MREKFTESRTYEQAYAIGIQRIKDAVSIYDKYAQWHAEKKGEGYFVKRSCPFCGSREYEEEEPFQERYGVARCSKCSSLYVNPCPTQEVLNDYYNHYACNKMLEDVYMERAKKPHNVILDERVETIAGYMEKLEKKEFRILEVGCSNGSFLSKLRRYADKKWPDRKVSYIGVDANSSAVDACRDEGLCLHAATIEDYLEKTMEKFDIIWHAELIEHLIDPYAVFQKLYQAMNRGGYMIFTTPNDASVEMGSISYNVPRVLACNILPPMHLNAFSTNNISHFVMRSGFDVVEISTPGKFDVEILEMETQHLKYEWLLGLKGLTEDQKEMIQRLLVMAGGSSHMQCVVRKR